MPYHIKSADGPVTLPRSGSATGFGGGAGPVNLNFRYSTGNEDPESPPSDAFQYCPAVSVFPTMVTPAGGLYWTYHFPDATIRQIWSNDQLPPFDLHVISTASNAYVTSYAVGATIGQGWGCADTLNDFYVHLRNTCRVFYVRRSTGLVTAGPLVIAGNVVASPQNKIACDPSTGTAYVVSQTSGADMIITACRNGAVVGSDTFAIGSVSAKCCWASNIGRLVITNVTGGSSPFWYYNPIAHTIVASSMTIGAVGPPFFVTGLNIVMAQSGLNFHFINVASDTLIVTRAASGTLNQPAYNSCSKRLFVPQTTGTYQYNPVTNYTQVGGLVLNNAAYTNFDRRTNLLYSVLFGSPNFFTQ